MHRLICHYPSCVWCPPVHRNSFHSCIGHTSLPLCTLSLLLECLLLIVKSLFIVQAPFQMSSPPKSLSWSFNSSLLLLYCGHIASTLYLTLFYLVFIYFILFMPLCMSLSLQWDIIHAEDENFIISLNLSVLTIFGPYKVFNKCLASIIFAILWSYHSLSNLYAFIPTVCSLWLGYLLPSPIHFATQIFYSYIGTSPIVMPP